MGKQWKQCQTIFLGSKITVDGDCSHEIKRNLLLGRKVMTNIDSILKNRDITLPTKVHLVKAMVFPLVMYGWLDCEEGWAPKNRCCVFELWCWRRLLRVPWTARRFNQSILREISPGCSLEGQMLKLKLQYIGSGDGGLIPGLRRSLGQRSLKACSPWGRVRVRHDWATSLSVFTFMHWKRKWQPTPVFLPGESQGRQSLVSCCLWGRTESDTTETT